jgi:hypothetical protein
MLIKCIITLMLWLGQGSCFNVVLLSQAITLHSSSCPFQEKPSKILLFFSRNFHTEINNEHLLFHIQGTADEVVDCSHGKQLWELSKEKFEPLWLSGGGHCNLELYPEFIQQLKKFVHAIGKSKAATNGSKKTTVESDNQSKPSETGPSDKYELGPDLPEVSRNSLDS